MPLTTFIDHFIIYWCSGRSDGISEGHCKYRHLKEKAAQMFWWSPFRWPWERQRVDNVLLLKRDGLWGGGESRGGCLPESDYKDRR